MNYRNRLGDSRITGNPKSTLTTGFRMLGIIVKYRLP
jgi:hypothetical protein